MKFSKMITKIYESVMIAAGIVLMFTTITLSLAALQHLNKDDERALCIRGEESKDVFTN